ncbi:MAG: ribonuclease H [Lactobacillus amylovorus]|nr:ribonuclease H [Lactobacillus amylovorus]
MNRHLEFYTDGAFSSKTEMGGWAAVCIEDGNVIDTQSGYEPYSTNNRMELTAFLSALENADTIETGNTKVTIYTDSAYIANCFNQNWYVKWMSNGWRTSDKQDVKNQDLWRRIVALYIKLKERLDLSIVKVKSHGSNKWNNYVDLLAQRERCKLEME